MRFDIIIHTTAGSDVAMITFHNVQARGFNDAHNWAEKTAQMLGLGFVASSVKVANHA